LPPALYKSIVSKRQNEKIRKIAIWGLSPVAKVTASFVMGISKNRYTFF